MYRWYAFDGLTRQLLHRDVPLEGWQVDRGIGAHVITGSIEPDRDSALKRENGTDIFQRWNTVIIGVDDGGAPTVGGVLTEHSRTGEVWEMTFTGHSAYPGGTLITDTHKWGGKTAGVGGRGVSPATVVAAYWQKLQSKTNAALGVEVVVDSTQYRMGSWIDTADPPTEEQLAKAKAAVAKAKSKTAKANAQKRLDKLNAQVSGAQEFEGLYDNIVKPPSAKGKTAYWEYVVGWWESAEYGERIDSLCEVAPYEVRETYALVGDGDDFRVKVHYVSPRLGRVNRDVVLTQGTSIIDALAIENQGDYANEVHWLGGGEGADMKRGNASSYGNRIRRAVGKSDQAIMSAATLKALAQRDLRIMRAEWDIASITLQRHSSVPDGSYDIGDDVFVDYTFAGATFKRWWRIQGIQSDSTGDVVTLTGRRSDTFDYVSTEVL